MITYRAEDVFKNMDEIPHATYFRINGSIYAAGKKTRVLDVETGNVALLTELIRSTESVDVLTQDEVNEILSKTV